MEAERINVELYDPHPGFAGCAVRIPEPVRLVAESLAGRQMPLSEAVSAIEEVKPDDSVVKEYNGFIALEAGSVDCGNFTIPQHNWRVIRYRSL